MTLVKVLVLLFFILAYAQAVDYPLSVTDDLGREVTLTAEPERVITMLPSHTETLCAIGACDKLVGRDSYSNYPAEVEGLREVGSAFEPSIESIVVLEPDLVIVDESSDLAATLEALGITVWAGSAQTFEDVFTTFTTLGQLVNREAEAAALAEDVRSDIDGIASLVADQPNPTVYYEIDPTPYSVGPESFIGVLLAKAGGKNIVTADLGDFPQLDPEYVVAADPDVIILGDAPYGETGATVAARAGWDSMSAVASGQIYELDAETVDAVSRPGPRIVDAVRTFAGLLYPDLID